MGIEDKAGHAAVARRGLARLIDGGSAYFDAGRHFERLFAGGSGQVDQSDEGRRRRLARLVRALRQERQRGRAGHWSYDLNRHIALAEAYVAEKRRLGIRRLPPGKDR